MHWNIVLLESEVANSVVDVVHDEKTSEMPFR